MDARYLPDYKYCTWCAEGTPKIDHNTYDCVEQFNPWYEMPDESESEAFHKSKKLKEQERLKQGFKPTGFPPSPPASPTKGHQLFVLSKVANQF